MNDENTLKKIWTQAILLPSTKLPELKLIGQPIPSQLWKGQFLLTREEKVDQLYYEALHKEAWQCGRTELGFQDWLDQQPGPPARQKRAKTQARCGERGWTVGEINAPGSWEKSARLS